MALPLRRGVGSLALRSFAACLRRHVPPPPPLETLAPVAPTPIHRCPLAPPCRHFAAPPQVNKKAKEDDDDGPRLNDAIGAPVVRLVTDEGHKVVSRHEALQLAARMDMDLVEVDKKSDPPVCRIMDFHKEKYNKDVKQKERLKSKSAIVLRGGENKEVRFKGKTELKDLMVKADAITRLMERGYRVKCMAMPSGNEGEDLGAPLSRLLGLIQDACIVESGPHLDSKHAYVIVRHVKFATKKGGKKASKAIEDAGKGTHVTASESPIESDSEADDKAISAQTGGKDQGFKRELNQSTANPGADHEKLQSINSGGSRTRPGQWGPQTPELRHDFKDARSDMNKGENYNQIKEHGENNRYAARRQPVREGNPSFSQGRYPKDRRDGNEGRYAMHDSQRPLEQHNQPLPRFNQGRVPQDPRNESRGPIPLNKGQRPLEQHNQPLPRFNQGRVAQDPRNENRGHIPLNNSQRQQPDGDSGGPNPTTKSFGIFSTPKPEPRKTNDAPASTPANTDSPKSYGIFSSKR